MTIGVIRFAVIGLFFAQKCKTLLVIPKPGMNALQATINQSIIRVISNPDVFCRGEKSVNAQDGAITDFSPKKTGSK